MSPIESALAYTGVALIVVLNVFFIVRRNVLRKRLIKKLSSMSREEQNAWFEGERKRNNGKETKQTLFAMSYFMNQHNSPLDGAGVEDFPVTRSSSDQSLWK